MGVGEGEVKCDVMSIFALVRVHVHRDHLNVGKVTGRLLTKKNEIAYFKRF